VNVRKTAITFIVMPGFMPGIHVFAVEKQGVDGRNKSGHDECQSFIALPG
jgi:hypothetical protein